MRKSAGFSFPSSRYTLLELKFASTFVSSSLDGILGSSTSFPIALTAIVNETAPLNSDGLLATFSAIWSSSFNVNSDELFTNESRYTFFYRKQTNISVVISESIFYVSNLQQPIARQIEVVFRNLLFTIIVLEVFGLVFLLSKLLLVPLYRKAIAFLRRYRLRDDRVETEDDLAVVVL